jgi:hypothetical protein
MDHRSLNIIVRNVVAIKCFQRLAIEGVLAERVNHWYCDVSFGSRFIPIKNCSVLNVHNVIHFFQI